jgi:poly-gamma-glutamate system protein
MEKWVKGKLSLFQIGVAMIILLIGIFLVEQTKSVQKTSYFAEQVEAAQLMKTCLETIKEERLNRNIPIDKRLDPNQTGIIGEEFTKITTTLGNIDSKRTSSNPDFAALMLKYFKEINLKRGDVIAIGASGSFPGLILATLSAAKIMDLNPLIIYSVGASQYGANIPEFTFITMLEVLNIRKILPYNLLALSMGGNFDQAQGMYYPDSRQIIEDIIRDAGSHFINMNNIAENIQYRMKLYEKAAAGQNTKAFINIGGATPNYGNTEASLKYPNGLVLNELEIPDNGERGLIFEYQSVGIPVIHLLDIRDLAIKNGLPIDPIPFPEIGTTGVYHQKAYDRIMIFLVIIIEFLYIWWASKMNNKRIAER